MSVYRDELLDAMRNGLAAYEAMERWVSRPPETHDDLPGAVLEGYARDLRESRERLLKMLAGHGNRDDIVEALAESERFHRSLGLSIRDKPEPIEQE
jgi:signal transduction protein with GAF and PtsI domain